MHADFKVFCILLFQIHLFAQYDGRNGIILDDSMTSTSMRLDNNCASIDKQAFYLYNSFCSIVLTVLIFLLLSYILHSVRPKLRNVLSPSLPQSTVNPNLAGLVLTGLVLSIYVLFCDSLTIYYSFGKHELRILHVYEDGHIQAITAFTVIFVFVVDSLTFLFSLINIIFLFKFRSETHHYQWLYEVLSTALRICTCDGRKRYYEPVRQTDNATSENIKQRKTKLENDLKKEKVHMHALLRKEKWLLQKRKEKRQIESQSVNQWFEQWKIELNQQEDEFEIRNHHYSLLKFQSPDEEYNIGLLKSEVKKWEEMLNKWSLELETSSSKSSTGTTTLDEYMQS